MGICRDDTPQKSLSSEPPNLSTETSCLQKKQGESALPSECRPPVACRSDDHENHMQNLQAERCSAPVDFNDGQGPSQQRKDTDLYEDESYRNTCAERASCMQNINPPYTGVPPEPYPSHSSETQDNQSHLSPQQPHLSPQQPRTSRSRKKSCEDSGKNVCRLCQKTLPPEVAMKEHMKEHKAMKQYECSHCDTTYTIRYSRDLHELVTHMEMLPYPCERCPEKFASMNALMKHTKVEHPKSAVTVSYSLAHLQQYIGLGTFRR